MIDTNRERQKAVREAWKREKAFIREGKGTRDWSQAEQREILSIGKATGYDGHHMKSVKDYPQHAGNPDNIQFLKLTEHIDGAHKGNTQNSTNGYYDPKTKQMSEFCNRNPKSPPSQNLSQPLTQRQQNIVIKREQARKQSVEQAKLEFKQSVSKAVISDPKEKYSKGNLKVTELSENHQNSIAPLNKAATNKGIIRMREQTDKALLASNNIENQSVNKGIETARQRYMSKTDSRSSSNKGITAYQSKAYELSTTVTKSDLVSKAKNSNNSQFSDNEQRR